MAQTHEHGAHVHGAAELDVVAEGKRLSITLESPADNLLGFEHAPKTPAETAKLQQVNAALKSAAKLFVPDAAGQCQAGSARITPPKFNQSGHSEYAVEYQFSCASVPAMVGLPLWQQFPKLKNVTVNLAVASGQKQLSLQPGQALKLQ